MLPVKHRLKKGKDFTALFRCGKTYSNDALMMKFNAEKNLGTSQFGFAVSLKFSKKAVERNQIKRWMREAIREKMSQIQPDQKIFFSINPRFPKEKISFKLIQDKTENLLKKAKLYPYRNTNP